MKREGNAVAKSLLALALGMLGCGGDAPPSGESLEFTHIYDAANDEGSLALTSTFPEAQTPGMLRVYVHAAGTEPLGSVGVENVGISLYGDTDIIWLVTADSIDVEVLSADGGKMQLADFELAGEVDWDGRSVTEDDREPGTFTASGWELAVDRSELSGTFAFDSPGNGHVEVSFTAPLYVDDGA